MKKQKEEVVDFTTRIQKSKSEELQKFARRDKRSVSALLIDAIDAYIEKRSREYRKSEPISE
jgi:predicted HicB family RNase H-like nuclease